jgi:hypothetical protein
MRAAARLAVTGDAPGAQAITRTWVAPKLRGFLRLAALPAGLHPTAGPIGERSGRGKVECEAVLGLADDVLSLLVRHEWSAVCHQDGPDGSADDKRGQFQGTARERKCGRQTWRSVLGKTSRASSVAFTNAASQAGPPDRGDDQVARSHYGQDQPREPDASQEPV